MIDVIVPMNNRSEWNNNELRYALRSAEQVLGDIIRRVFIIGTLPNSIKNVVHVPFRDKSTFPATNIYRKLMNICLHHDVSDGFIFMADDQYLLNGFMFDAAYYSQPLEDELRYHPNPIYKRTLRNTLQALLDLGKPTMNYDIHLPLLMNKQVFIEAMRQVDWVRQDYGYCIKSLYCNIAEVHGVKTFDAKVRSGQTLEYYHEFMKTRVGISSSDHVNQDFKNLLNQLYPKKSKYEY